MTSGRGVTLDAVVIQRDDARHWPDAGESVSLQLEPPDSHWMSGAMIQLLKKWSEENQVFRAAIITGGPEDVVRIEHGGTVVSLPLRSAVPHHT